MVPRSPLQWLYDWAVAEEPAHLDPPPNLIAATLFDGFFQAPALLFVMTGLVRLRAWLRPLGSSLSAISTATERSGWGAMRAPIARAEPPGLQD